MDTENKESEHEEVEEEVEEVIEDGESVIEEEVEEEVEYEEVEEEEYEEEVVEEGEGTSENPINIEEEVVTTDVDAADTEDADNADGGDDEQEASSQQGDEEQGLIEDDVQSRDLKFVAERKPPKSSGSYWLICLLIAGLLGGLAYLGFYLTEEENKDRSNPSLANTSPTNPPTIATVSNFDTIQGNCDNYFGLTTPHPYDQCACAGSITNVPEDIASRYNYLVSAFVGSLYGGGDWLAKDISECLPENQALVWLSTSENSQYSEEEQQQRFALATLFTATQGMQWSDKQSWMSNSDSCTWFGVQCDGTAAAVIGLENNRMKGTVSIFVVCIVQ